MKCITNPVIRQWLDAFIILAIVVIGLIVPIWLIGANYVVIFEFFATTKEGTSYSEVLRNLGLLLVGLIGLGLGAWRAYTAHQQTQASHRQTKAAEKQAETSARGLFAERSAEAAKQLGDQNLAVRLGGLYALAALGRNADRADVESLVNVICAFIRNPTKEQEEAKNEDEEEQETQEVNNESTERIQRASNNKPRPDINVALAIVTKSKYGMAGRYSDLELDLDGADLLFGNIEGALMERANLRGANLEGANLLGANLEGANLLGANLLGANLEGANLRGANLVRANLVRANLILANLEMGNLEKANLRGANLLGANLLGANLLGANLEMGDLEKANLRGANLFGANLLGANLLGANLKGTNLDGATR